MRTRYPATKILGGLTAVTLFGLSALMAKDPSEVVPKPSAWDEEAAAAFVAAGIPQPRTVMTSETDAPLDRAWIRRAFGWAKPLTKAEIATLDGGAREGALAGRRSMRGRTGAAGGAATPGAEEEMQERSRRSDDRAAPAPSRAAPSDSARPQSEPGVGAGSFGAAAAKEKKSAGKDADVPQPVLSKIKTQPRLGKVLFRNAQGKFESLTPRAMRVVTFLDGPRARTSIDLVFENPHDRRLQGTFYYPLPDGSSPAAFGMFPGSARVTDAAALGKSSLLPPLSAEVDPTKLTSLAPQAHAGAKNTTSPSSQAQELIQDWKPIQQARVVEQKRARQVYEEVVRKQVDPALMEWSGGNTFKARVFPIEPRGLKRLVFVFEHTLPREQSSNRYVFPFPGQKSLGEIEALVHVRGAGPTGMLALQQDSLKPQGPPTQAGAWTRHRFVAPAGYAGALDLATTAMGPQVLRGPAAGLGEATYVRVQPMVPDRSRQTPTKRALFLVDTSLSEEGVRRALSGQLLLEVLERDPTIEEYAVLLFDVRPRWLHAAGYRKNTKDTRAATKAELAKVYLEGATNFASVLDELDRQASWVDKDGAAVRFLLSDGLITWGLDRTDELLRSHPKALAGPWFSYRFGDVAVNRNLYDALSRATAGRTVNVLSAEQIAAASVAHRKAPVVLDSVKVTGATGKDLVIAGAPRLLFPGQELEVACRLEGATPKAALQVVLSVEGEKQTQEIPLDGSGSTFAGRAWAELWTRKLLALDDERLDKMVVALSQTFALANKAASLLILEDEKAWKEFNLENEQVDMADLQRLRAIEEDQRRDRLQGIALDKASPAARELVRLLAKLELAALQPALPLLNRPLAGGEGRIKVEVNYRAARAKDPLDVTVYDAVARARALSGDTLGAVRALSCLVEKRPRDAEANRLVGYACLALGQYGPAVELFERVRLNRPFEPQAFLEEALALEADGRYSEAARNYEILLSRSFPRHLSEVRVVAGYHYGRLLGTLLRAAKLDEATQAAMTKRKEEVLSTLPRKGERTPLQVSIHWNTDSTDIDLWVKEPEGEKCFYSHKTTQAGGKLFWDTTTGYGPELYRRSKASEGEFDVLIHYYGNNSPRWSIPTSVLEVRDLDVFGPEDAFTRRFSMRILPKSKAVLRLEKLTP